MKSFMGAVMALTLLGAQAAMACSGSPPPNCSCKNNQWVDNTTNIVYNYNNQTTVNGVNGNVSPTATAGAGATSSATGGNSSATGGNATGGNASANGSVNSSGNSNQQQSINNSGNQSATSSSSIAKGAVTNTNTVAGGAGGQGGAGGAGGNATIAKGAVQNTNSNVNNVAGGTSSASISSGAVQNTVGSTSSVGNVSSGASTATVGAVSTGASTSNATAEASGNGSGNGNGTNTTNVSYEGSRTYRAPVATAYSASLTSGADTCLGSISGGAQTQILGITLGGTKRDKGCDLIKQTHLLMELNQARAACIRAQLKEEGALIKEAMKEAGAECPPLVVALPEVSVAPVPADAVTHAELRLIEDRITTKIVSK